MSERAPDAKLLRGKRVAFTGRLASMTRQEAAELVRNHGGEFVPAVTRRTPLLVVGQEGWPLQKDGRLTRKLQQARQLIQHGHPMTVLPEEGVLAQLGLEARSEGIHQLYNAAQLCQILHLGRDRLRAWVRAGIISPVETVNGVSYFSFQQVTGAKTLCDLARAGVTPQRIRRSLEQLRAWMPNVEQPLSQLAVLERDGAMLVRLEDGQLVEPTGQLQFDFAEEQQASHLSPNPSPEGGGELPSPIRGGVGGEVAEWFTLGCQHEDAGHMDDAAHAYREALRQGGPDAEICFNLANVLYALGQKEQAAERFHQVVEIDNGFAESWNNLGNVLAELGQHEEAVRAYQGAIHVDPHYADAVYNLADLLDQMGCHEEAAQHWRAYLRQDSTSQWGDYARQRLFLSKNA